MHRKIFPSVLQCKMYGMEKVIMILEKGLIMFLFCSTSKHGQVVYKGPEREFEEVTKSLDSIGPEVIQTLSVSRNHSLLHRMK